MTPKEKAVELFKKNYKLLPKNGTVIIEDSKEISWGYDDYYTAKQCALIAVDEIIWSIKCSMTEYWEDY